MIISEVSERIDRIGQSEYVVQSEVDSIDLGRGSAHIRVVLQSDLFYRILGETTGLQIDGEADLLSRMIELAKIKKKYEKMLYFC